MTASFGYGVDLDLLEETTASMAQCGRALDDLLDDVAQRVAELHVTWSGQAAAAHTTAQAAWEAGFRAMRDGLATMRAAGEAAGSSYRSAADTNRLMWEQLS